MSYIATNLQVEAVVSNLHNKMTAQTVFVHKKSGLSMRRASKKPPMGSIVVGTFTREDDPEIIRNKVRQMASAGELQFKFN